MSDFGRILDEWKSRPSGSGRDEPERLERPLDMDALLRRYPPEDKDAARPAGAESAEGPSDQSRPLHPERIPVDATLDLHGYRLQPAIEITDAFIERSVADGLQKVLIIHGKGENGQGVLRREIRSHLERHPLTGAMGYNRGPDGGRGALWVMLRKKAAGRPPVHRSR